MLHLSSGHHPLSWRVSLLFDGQDFNIRHYLMISSSCQTCCWTVNVLNVVCLCFPSWSLSCSFIPEGLSFRPSLSSIQIHFYWHLYVWVVDQNPGQGLLHRALHLPEGPLELAGLQRHCYGVSLYNSEFHTLSFFSQNLQNVIQFNVVYK